MDDWNLSDFDYHLPPERIAQNPTAQRDGSRLLVLERGSGTIHHHAFRDFPGFIQPQDLLVVNNTRVFPARCHGTKGESGAQCELLLLEEASPGTWWCMVRPGKRLPVGQVVSLRQANGEPGAWKAKILEKNQEGHALCSFDPPNVLEWIHEAGAPPLPPYIRRDAGLNAEDPERYQTVYASQSGSVAAPTAGLHFTPEILQEVKSKGAQVAEVTLHVGMGTFAPVKAERVRDHVMHEERYEVTEATAEQIRKTKAAGGRVFAVGTTSLRVLESVVDPETSEIRAGSGRTRLFVRPPYNFRCVDALLTNFHLPKSTLLMLVSAFAAPGETRAGLDRVRQAYEIAIQEEYRFFSYGDAMLVYTARP